MNCFSNVHVASSLLAYVDGGTGSMILQACVAGVLTSAYMVKTRWASLRAFLSSRKHKNQPHA